MIARLRAWIISRHQLVKERDQAFAERDAAIAQMARMLAKFSVVEIQAMHRIDQAEGRAHELEEELRRIGAFGAFERRRSA